MVAFWVLAVLLFLSILLELSTAVLFPFVIIAIICAVGLLYTCGFWRTAGIFIAGVIAFLIGFVVAESLYYPDGLPPIADEMPGVAVLPPGTITDTVYEAVQAVHGFISPWAYIPFTVWLISAFVVITVLGYLVVKSEIIRHGPIRLRPIGGGRRVDRYEIRRRIQRDKDNARITRVYGKLINEMSDVYKEAYKNIDADTFTK